MYLDFCLSFLSNHIERWLLLFLQVLERRTYFCTKDYDEGYFDFHCLPNGEPASDEVEWYTICGTPFPNRAEYICAISIVTFVAVVVFYNMLFKSSATVICKQKPKSKVN